MSYTFDTSRLPTSPLLFWLLLGTIISAGLARSWVATSVDAPQIDEAWHAVAGVSYARRGDFRLNPEHPPLVKSWVGATMPGTFVLPAFRALEDKTDERKFIEDIFYLDNDPDWVQQRMRLSMLALNGALLLALGFCLRRALGSGLTLVAIALLLIDPTVAAHLPLVLTDLPVTLLSAVTVLLAFFAFRSWRAGDLLLAAVALGLTLATKHSALVLGLAVFLLALACTFVLRDSVRKTALVPRLTRVAMVFVGAYAILWAFYGFRFDERNEAPAATHTVTFNRSIEDKIGDLTRPASRAAIQLALDWHVLPRAYLWGLADIARVGLEGRTDTYVLGSLIRGDTPWYFFPLVLTTKLPLGLLCFALAGALLLGLRPVRSHGAQWLPALLVLLGWAAFHMTFLMRGNSGYAGVRHALPVYPTIAVLAALPIVLALATKSLTARVVVGVGLVLTLATALPHMRPWEYYNQLVGGPEQAWRCFADEGVDSGQRVKDIVRYYDQHLRGTGERVYDYYGLSEADRAAHKLEFDVVEDNPYDDSKILEGTVFTSTTRLAPTPAYDHAAFRDAKPAARFGNLLVLRGKFEIPWLPAQRKTDAAFDALNAETPDLALAEKLLTDVATSYPEDHQASFDLGNLLLERGDTQAALRAYELSRKYAQGSDELSVELLNRQIAALSSGRTVQPIRPPWLE